MARSLNRPQKSFALALAVTIAMAFMPMSWLRWVSDVSEVVRVPISPFGHAGNAFKAWLRPHSVYADRPLDLLTEEKLLEEIERYKRLYHAADLRALELQEQLEQIQMMPLDDLRAPVRPMVATITARNPRSVTDLVQVNRGERHRVEPGTVAAYGGVHLIGRIVDVTNLHSHLLPITNPTSGYIDARVIPRDQPEAAMSAAPLIQLEPRGDGTYIAHAEHTDQIAVGDVVRLHDANWPASAQAMIVGVIDSVKPNDQNSLLKTLIIRPRHHVHQVANVTLMLELDPVTARAEQSAGDGS